MHEKINYNGWPNCIRLFNAETELIVTTDVGPRIIHFGFINQQNFLYRSPEDSGKTGGSDWRLYGGHRLWLAPETMPFTYHPDNLPVAYTVEESGIRLTASRENVSGFVKEIEIRLSAEENRVSIVHRLLNESGQGVEAGPWAITALAPGGQAIIPNEPYGEGNDYLLPARSLALWQYTKMNDPRWDWGDRYIRATQDGAYTSEQKIGLLNKQEWSAYYLNNEIFIKHFQYDPSASYPDYGSNNEVYINGDFLEIESLGAMSVIAAGGRVEHLEHWALARSIELKDEASIDEVVLPLVAALKNSAKQ